jgi:phospholipase C
MKNRLPCSKSFFYAAIFAAVFLLVFLLAGCGGTTASAEGRGTGGGSAPTVTLAASPTTISSGQSSTLSWTTTNATSVQVDNGIGAVQAPNGSVKVSPTQTTTYTITATGAGGSATAQVTVTVTPAGPPPGSVNSIDHVIFMLQENRSFDSYFGMLNPYRQENGFNVGDDGKTYNVDGIDDKLSRFANVNDEGQSFSLFKLTSTCVDDMTSAWLESYGDVNRYDFSLNRPVLMDGFVHVAEGYAKSGAGDGQFTDVAGKRAMGYYDQDLLNYYYYMASQFAISDRWFAPVASKSTPNRIATMTGGTTQGLVRDPFVDDKFAKQLNIETIFQELDQNNVPWKIYYSLTAGGCTDTKGDCGQAHSSDYPVTTFSDFSYSNKYLYENPQQAQCIAPTIGSQQAVGDPSNAFCIDVNHIAPLSHYFSDVTNNTLPSYAFIETAFGSSDEHPGSGQPILKGQQQVSTIINALMQSRSWSSSVFFLSYDEPGGPFDHVPPVPGHSNDNTDASLGAIPDIGSIAVNADSYQPCVPPGGTPTLHCDLKSTDPGANSGDAAAQKGFAAQLGFRVPNLVVSPFARKHYVSHIPMDHTAILKFVENRFINSSAHLTNRDAAQPNLLDFFDFTNVPWATPPTPPTPTPPPGACTPQTM